MPSIPNYDSIRLNPNWERRTVYDVRTFTLLQRTKEGMSHGVAMPWVNSHRAMPVSDD